ncbi:hypothetical protein ACFE04_001671 [Oxalis oulophora]
MEAENSSSSRKEETLPPGFRFHPTDEELITYYLINKISDSNFSARAVADVDLNKSEPWELPGKAKMGEKEWYFFSLRDRKYPTGVRTNRATNTGYWKTTGKDKEIFNSVSSELVGMKKTLVFYRGRAPRGEKSNWVMHEYRLHSKSAFRTSKDEWVVCRVFQKTAGIKKYPSNPTRSSIPHYGLDIGPSHNHHHHVFPPPMMHQPDNFQFPVGGRNYPSDLAEFTRTLRTGASTSLTSHQLPFQPQLNYPAAPNFTISGLNLNLRGGPQPMPVMTQPQDMASSSSFQAENNNNNNNGYGVVEPGVVNRSYNMGMDQCMDLENYWPPYN